MACVKCGGTRTAAEIRGFEYNYYEDEIDIRAKYTDDEWDTYQREQEEEAKVISKMLRDKWIASDNTLDEWYTDELDTVCHCDDDGRTVVYPDGYVIMAPDGGLKEHIHNYKYMI